MKKILILRTEMAKDNPDYLMIGYLRKTYGDQIQVDLKGFSETLIEMSPGKVAVYFGQKKASDYDLIWMRKTGERLAKFGAALGACFDYLGIKYFDTCFGKRAIGGNKLLAFLQLAIADLPIPLTFFCWRSQAEKNGAHFIKKLGFPMMGKLTGVHWGEGVFVINDEKDLDRFLRRSAGQSQVFFQKFHPHKGDYRVLVLGYQVGAWEIMYRQAELRPGRKDDFRPVGHLKKKEFFPVEKIPPKMADLAIKAARAVSLEIAGADFIKDLNTGEYLIPEVNRAPGFATDYPGDPELSAIASFLKKSVGL